LYLAIPNTDNKSVTVGVAKDAAGGRKRVAKVVRILAKTVGLASETSICQAFMFQDESS
jgi:hypothetical protein